MCFHVSNVGFLLQAVEAKYTEIAASTGPDQEVMFEEDQITLDIPKKGLHACQLLPSLWA